MKRLLILPAILFSLTGLAQSPQYDVAPTFPGGNEGLEKYLTEKLVYPKDAQAQHVQGKVLLGFMITEKGQVGDINVLRHVHPLLDSEAVRVVRAMPRWKPAKKGRKNVAAPVSLPITFMLKR